MNHKPQSHQMTTKTQVLAIVALPICLSTLLLALLSQQIRVTAQRKMPGADTSSVAIADPKPIGKADSFALFTSSGTGIAWSNMLSVVSARPNGLDRYQEQAFGAEWSAMDSWVSGGPYGGAIRELVIPPAGDAKLFAGTWGSGVYRIDPGGTAWYPVNTNLPNGLIKALAISPNYENDQTLFVAGCEWGVYRTTDGGDEWQPAQEGIPTTEVTALAVSPAYASDRVVYAGTAGSGIYRSTNGGQSWTAASTGLNNLSIMEIVIAPDFDLTDRVYALTNWTVHRSDDGVTWTPLDTAPEGANELSIALTPDGSTLFLGTDGKGVYNGTATGSSWSPANTGISDRRIDDIVISPNYTNDHTLWATNDYGDRVYRSTNGGVSWTETISGLTTPDGSEGISPYVLAVSPDYSDDATVFVGSSWHGGVFHSRSSGNQWQPFSSGLSWWVHDIAISPAYAADKTVFVGVNGGGILKSVDRGASWQMSSRGFAGDGMAVALSPGFTVDRTAFTGGWQTGIYRSVDGGASWQQSGLAGETINALAISPSDLIAHAEILAGTDSGLYRSPDVGLSWSVITSNLPVSSVKTIAHSPTYADDHTVFIGSGCLCATRGVFRSTNSGANWTYLGGGPEERVYALAVSPDFDSDRTVFASTYGVLYRSTDAGDTWSTASLTAPYVTDIAFSPDYDTDRTIWAATSQDGVYLSTDGGQTWTPANNHLADLRTEAIAVSPARTSGTSDVFVGTASMGVWQTYQDVDLIVRAYGTVASGEWPSVEVRFNDAVVANWIISTTEYTLWMTDTNAPNQDKVDVAFLNNGGEVSPDDQRDVYIDFVQVGNKQVSSIDPSTMVDRNGDIPVYRDGLDSVAGVKRLAWDATSRFLVGATPESAAPPWSGLHRMIADTHIDDAVDWPSKRAVHLDTNSQGHTVLVWYDERNYDWWGNIYAQWIAPDGTPRGDNVAVNDDGSRNHGQHDPAVLVNDDGTAIIVWADSRNEHDVFAQRFDASGNHIGVNVSVTDGTLERKYKYPDIDGIGDGSFAVVWNQDRSVRIFGRWYDQNGSPTSEVVQVSEEQAEETHRSRAKVAVSASGRTLVVWQDRRNDDFDIYGQWHSADGTPLGGNFRINDDVSNAEQLTPDVSASGEGFFVVWRDYREGNEDIYAQRFDGEGNQVGSNFRVNEDVGIARQHAPRVACDRSGWCAVTWWDRRGVVPDVYGQLYDPDGAPQGGNFKVDSGPSGSSQFDPAVVWDEGDNIWFAWSDNREEARNLDIYASKWHIDKPGSPGSAPDIHEPDDVCEGANLAPTDGRGQEHNFHDPGDADWVWFEATAGSTYVVQTAHAGPNADTVLELFNACAQPPSQSDDNDFGPGASITFQAPTSGTYYVKVSQHDPAVYGDGTDYQLSIRTHSATPIVAIVAGRNDTDDLEANIAFTGDQAYRTFRRAGVPRQNIHYLSVGPNRDADKDGYLDIDDTPSWQNVRYAIQDWPRERGLHLGVPFYLYLADHGGTDYYCAMGCTSDAWVRAEDLDLWLSNLEATTGADEINVVIEACYSGSFIDVTTYGPAEISSPGRVVIASTGSGARSFPSERGGYFSDAFFTALGDNADLWTAYVAGRTAARAAWSAQTPWLDDNGDTVADGSDGQVARGRGLASFAGGAIPVVDWLAVGEVSESGIATITAQIRDDVAVVTATVEVYPPGIEVPETGEGETPVLPVDRVELQDDDSDDVYEGVYTGFTEEEVYRLVAYAWDNDGNLSLPREVTVGEREVFLPLVLKQSKG